MSDETEELSDQEVDALSQAMGDATVTEAELPEEPASEPVAETPQAEPESQQEREPGSGEPTISKAHFMQLEEIAEAADLPPQDMEKMYDIKVHVEVLLGKTRMPLEKILRLHPGSVVELNKLAGEAVDVIANGKLIARAEVVVIEENFGIKILEIVGTKQKLNVIGR